MSRFWAAASSSEDEKDSDNESLNEAQPAQKQAERKFAGTFDESDSGEHDMHSLAASSPANFFHCALFRF